MLQEVYSKKNKRYTKVLCDSFLMLQPCEKVVDGVLTRTSSFVRHSVADDYKDFTYLDFAIGNILATGATNLFAPVTMVNHDVAGVAQAFDDLNAKLNDNEVSK